MSGPDASSRFFILEVPAMAPGKCIVCGSCGGDGRKFIDISMTVEFYGKVYFCSFCFEECCSYLGWMSQENNELQEMEIQELKDTNVTIQQLLDSRLDGLISELSALKAQSEVAKRTVGRPKKTEQ